jgi:homospermidine synthase
MINKIYFIGFGAVAKTLMDLWNITKQFKTIKTIIIEPLDVPKWISRGRIVKHIKESITKDNYKKLLKNIDSNTFIIDLSVNVDALMLIELAIKKGSMYINTSLEQWQEEPNPTASTYKEIRDNTLYYRQKLLDKLVKKSSSTILTDMGMNPGGVESIALNTIDKLYIEKGLSCGKDCKCTHAQKAKKMGIQTIHISEVDTQEITRPYDEKEFVSTWSALGFTAEATDNSTLYLGTHEIDQDEFIKPDDGSRIRFYKTPALNVMQKSICLDHSGKPHDYKGFIIPHGETSRMGEYLTVREGKEIKYCPSVYYVYRPCPRAVLSLQDLKNNDYKPLEKWHVVEQEEIKNKTGYDTVGVTIYFEDGSIYTACTSVNLMDVRKLKLKHATPTTLQVAAFMNASINYMLREKKEGVIDPEDLPYIKILNLAKPYLGNFYEKWIK